MPTPLSVINDALGNTANGTITSAQLAAVPNDALTENHANYVADRAARAYNREIRLLLARHQWPFAKSTAALVQVVAANNPSNRFGYAYTWPSTALWLQAVEAPGGLALDYEIIGLFICTDFNGTGTNSPIATYIIVPADAAISDMFWEVLRAKVEVGILRSVNEDYAEAKRRDDACEAMLLPLIRNRSDQQLPARRAFFSTALERRRSGGGPRAP